MNLADYLDAAILKPDMSTAEVLEAVEVCIPYRPKTLCVRPGDLALVKPFCEQHGMGLCVVLGFPHGSQLTESKVDEARRYVDLGVDEIDMVCNIGLVRSGEWERVQHDIQAVAEVSHAAGIPLKVIFETCFLTPEQIERLVHVCVAAGADYVKTSTGFNGEGAQDDDVALMVKTAAGRIKVKPSGGIRNRERAEALIQMGADRLGVGFSSVPGLCGDGDVQGSGY
jgi:deoxyribose-phosphate aldolase